MRASRLLGVLGVPVFLVTVVSAQTPNFSGTWSYSGAKPHQWAMMAGINCGPECTITQNDKTLTLTRPANQPGAPDTGLVVLNLDGSDSTVTPSKGSPFVVHAKWDGGKLVVTHEMTYFTIRQTLSVADGKLTIVNDMTGDGKMVVTEPYVQK